MYKIEFTILWVNRHNTDKTYWLPSEKGSQSVPIREVGRKMEWFTSEGVAKGWQFLPRRQPLLLAAGASHCEEFPNWPFCFPFYSEQQLQEQG